MCVSVACDGTSSSYLYDGMLPKERILLALSMESSCEWFDVDAVYFFEIGFFTYGGSYLGTVLFLHSWMNEKGNERIKQKSLINNYVIVFEQNTFKLPCMFFW